MVVSEHGHEEVSRHEAIELVLARLLRIGSIVAAFLLAGGIAGMAIHEPFATKMITAGLLVLLGTPILRVLAAFVIFLRDREWHYALFSLVVLAALAAGIILGRAG
ncbi:DUF1634 domain-containing protein [Geomonas sp. Red32]|uniref:DUF1634 domain-containing protein n=1 Tax=Geomonas sp. Red32 TaxID=2912856 RepID=UPI00202CAEDD|nr:DUF1634 domain-containing protein [Geomonas sp. Red32]